MIRGEELNTVEPLKRHHFWVYKMSPETEKLNNASKEMRLKTKTIDVCEQNDVKHDADAHQARNLVTFMEKFDLFQ